MIKYSYRLPWREPEDVFVFKYRSLHVTKQFKPILWTVFGVASLLLAAVFFLTPKTNPTHARMVKAMRGSLRPIIPSLERAELLHALGKRSIRVNALQADGLALTVKGKQVIAKLTIDRELQERIEDIYDQYDPDFAAFVAMDPETGKILAMADRAIDNRENLALSATFPAASVFKIVTSAAALDERKIQPRTVIPVNGAFGTLYKRNLREQITRWTRFISIEEAFAKSVNSAFAKIAMKNLGPQDLQKYANSFGFNQQIPFDLAIESSSAIIPEDDSFGLAESGSGYTRRQTLNPIQGAMIASAIIQEGQMPAPYIVESAKNESGSILYEAEPKKFSHPIDKITAHSLSMIMEHTITQGTARKEYRDYNHHPILSKVFVGAKTGSLSGDNPAGRYDWFVGFAQSSTNPKRKIAFASLIINRKYWKVKSSHVAREAIINYFGRKTDL